MPIDDAPALGEAIGRLLDVPALAARLAAAGRQRYEDEFTEAACVARYLRLFRRVLEDRRVGAAASQ